MHQRKDTWRMNGTEGTNWKCLTDAQNNIEQIEWTVSVVVLSGFEYIGQEFPILYLIK